MIITHEEESKMGPRHRAPDQACLLCLLVAGLLQYCAVQAASRQASCNVAGFTFRPQQVPTSYGTADTVKLLTLPYPPGNYNRVYDRGPRPFPDLSSTAAACSAETACGMFTSDGYIIGGYRYDPLQGSREIIAEDRVVGWRPMEYCSWACCGTWDADGFVAQLAQPTPLSAAAAGSPLVRINATDLPVDSVSVIAMRTDILQTVCVGKPNHNLTSLDKQRVSPPGTPDCPQRCLVACCKQLAISGGDSRDLIGPTMGQYHFSQCSGTACLHCGYAFGSVEATGNEVVLLRAYARDRSLSAAGTPVSAQPSGKVSCIHGSTTVAKSGDGSLC